MGTVNRGNFHPGRVGMVEFQRWLELAPPDQLEAFGRALFPMRWSCVSVANRPAFGRFPQVLDFRLIADTGFLRSSAREPNPPPRFP